MEAGLEDVVFLVINGARDAGTADLVEHFDLPILQDTEEAGVYGLYGARDYDAFIVDREGFIGFAATWVHPLDDGGALLEEVLAFR